MAHTFSSDCRRIFQLFKNVVFFSALCLATLALFPARSSAQPTPIAHWSFDTPTLTIVDGNITEVAEETGDHDATPGIGGTGGGSGTQFVSAPFPAAASSVAGSFGQAMRFNGDNFFLFPQLTELMAANGGPSYSVSMWINTTAGLSSAHPFAALGSWGNQPNTVAGTRFTYAFGPSNTLPNSEAGPTTTMRAQSRRNEPTSGGGGTNGDDIFARNATTPTTINDGNWHMLSWTFDTTSGQLISYFDATQVDTFTSTDPSFAMGDSSSPVGGIGIKGDNGIYIPQGVNLDEIWVFDSVLTADEVATLRDQNGFGPPPMLGDVDLDGDVDMDDFSPIRDNFRKTVSTRAQGDLVRNNTVDFDDFGQWKTAFLGGGGSLAGVDLGFADNVPEPATGLLLLLAGAMLSGRRRRA
jgi:hypothetical protein